MTRDSLGRDKYHQMRLALDELVDGDLRRFRPDRRTGLDLRPERRRLDRLDGSSSDDEGVLKIKDRPYKIFYILPSGFSRPLLRNIFDYSCDGLSSNFGL